MDSILARRQVKLNKQREKSAKNEGRTDIEELQHAIDQMRMEKQVLVDEIARADQGYRDHAKSKLERKLKTGMTAQLAEKHQNSVDAQRAKLPVKLDAIRSKIEKAENKKDKMIADIDAKIFTLERQIRQLEGEKNNISTDAEQKVSDLEKELERTEISGESTIKYYQGLVDRCYEEQTPDVAYPPSYYKKKERIRELDISIETTSHNILQIKASQYDSKKEVDPREEEIKRARARAQREEQMELEEATARAREADERAAVLRKMELDREKQEIRERHQRAEERGERVIVPGSVVSFNRQVFDDRSDYDTDGEEITTERERRNRRSRINKRNQEWDEEYDELDPEILKKNRMTALKNGYAK